MDNENGDDPEWNVGEDIEGVSDGTGFDWREMLEDVFPADEEATLDRVHRVSDLLDEAVVIPGTNYRIGLDPIVGILPVAGDSVTTVISLYIVGEAARAGVSRSTLATMIGLVAIDAVVGSIPVLGTIFDAVWKANKWNVSLLERELDAAE